MYFDILICPFNTKSLLRLHGFLHTRLFFSKYGISRGPLYMTLLFMFLLLLCTETNYWCSCKCYKPWPLSHDNNDSCLKRTMLYVVCKDNTKKILYQWLIRTHWTSWLQIFSQFCPQRVISLETESCRTPSPPKKIIRHNTVSGTWTENKEI